MALTRRTFSAQRRPRADRDDLEHRIDGGGCDRQPGPGGGKRPGHRDGGRPGPPVQPPAQARDRPADRQGQHPPSGRGVQHADQKGVLGVAEGDVLHRVQQPGEDDRGQAGGQPGAERGGQQPRVKRAPPLVVVPKYLGVALHLGMAPYLGVAPLGCATRSVPE